ncbi:P-loop containing nucleoside triphosphate hydrolase protein [Anaeromyces robustus]|jgi:ATP-binding cassette subfamily A (ABC1) protein 5|uniref:p-loop containing nucleoside triphosphate hydrolase protein n=1 Tax=Anaeromyces robustus TaxID=1754192 RepID=A0A1Y1XIR0_9FUNG|nr:P-loop containing nucleoside triphosphate hydrolase protein [Anaeromyces robustus]|eukprot:ORX85647.1 P-loop containing nucleoside triphosphate hydrolase protein [Anaeromyces robustus]
MGNYLNQLKALLKRNFLLKKASKSQIIGEIIFPLYIVFMTYLTSKISSPETYEKADPTPTQDIKSIFDVYSTFLSDKVPTIGFVLPENSQDKSIINNIMDNELFTNSTIKFEPQEFSNEKAMNDFNNDYNNFLLAGIIFESNDYLQYTLRVNGTNTPDPNSDPIINYALGRYQAESSGTQADKYLAVFSPIQTAVDQAIIRLKTNDNTFTMKHSFGKLGKAPSKYSSGESGNNNGLYIGLLFMMPMSIIVMNIVKEKEDKIKDGLLMAGVHPTLFWLSWIILYVVIIFITVAIIIVFYVVTKTYSFINPIIFFIALFLYGISCICASFVFTTFFNKTKTAGTTIILFVLFFSFLNFLNSTLSVGIRKIISIFLSPVSIGSFIYEAENMRSRLINLNFNNLFSSNPGFFLLMLLVNIAIYFIIAVYLDTLSVKEFSSKKAINELKSEDNVNYQRDIQEDFNARNNEKCRVEVNEVYKIFNKKDKSNKKSKKNRFLAVNDVSFKVYQNEIFAILGHNGAGKTTLINIMVGLLNASKGDVYFDGMNISSNKNKTKIREKFGVCAQTNIIYDQLTVEDHINFYAGLKGVTVDVDEILREIDLVGKKNTKASKLSGGQKRKLCIGMALIGNPQYIFLDEPTTGLDPLSRRKIWELLSKHKEGKVIFLTTHYMDEADILADRKLILNKGKIRCLGTSLYLKNHFNMSYNLDIETKDKDYVNKLVQSYLPEATYIENPENSINNNEVQCHTWKLPLNTSSRFSSLLNELENQSGSNKLIQKFALSMPTLEELFIRLEDDSIDNEDQNNRDIDGNKHILDMNDDKLPKLKPIEKPSKLSILINLIKYRLKIFLKDKGFAFNSILTPVIVTGVMLFLYSKLINQLTNQTYNAKELSASSIYSDTIINIDSQSNIKLPMSGVKTSSLSLNEIKDPQYGEDYYLSSINVQNMNNNYYFSTNYNDTMTHSVPATINAISNSVLESKNVNGKIIMKSYPYEVKINITSIILLSLCGFFISYSIVSCLSKFGSLAVRERVNQLLQQLQLNGVSRMNYWLSSFITDNSLFLLTALLIILVGIAVKFEPLYDLKVLVVMAIGILIWSIPSMIYQYVLSFLFKKEDTAFSMLGIVNMYSILIGYIVGLVIDQALGNNVVENLILGKGLCSMTSILFNILFTILFPPYGLLVILNSLFNIKMYNVMINYDMSFSNIFKFTNGITPILITLIVIAFIYFGLLIFIDKKVNQTNKSDIHEIPRDILRSHEQKLREGDSDVYQEFEYIKNHEKELPVSVYHLSKEYKANVSNLDKEKKEEIENRHPDFVKFGDIHKSLITEKLVKTAVEDVSFGVRNHECFGLLGPNGAGKSTTLNTITSTIPQTTGKICFDGIETHLARLGEISMGYCPQNDILWKELTLREHIEFFLSIRGYKGNDVKEYATQYINAAGLEDHQNKRVDDLSGGTKRKLSILIAICGYPKRILLDEPTAGMDPSTRRLVWNIIEKTKVMNDSALIMTTHSMEEAENLCDRLAILVNGRLTCIGSPEHLKMKYGDSYVLELQSKYLGKFHQEIVERGQLFGNNTYTMEKSSSERAKYEVKMTKNIGQVFEIMERCKSQGFVTDYSFSQTSLEQVFINFAKQQVETQDN